MYIDMRKALIGSTKLPTTLGKLQAPIWTIQKNHLINLAELHMIRERQMLSEHIGNGCLFGRLIWMIIYGRSPLNTVDCSVWRNFSMGSLLDLVILDTRQYDRAITGTSSRGPWYKICTGIRNISPKLPTMMAEAYSIWRYDWQTSWWGTCKRTGFMKRYRSRRRMLSAQKTTRR